MAQRRWARVTVLRAALAAALATAVAGGAVLVGRHLIGSARPSLHPEAGWPTAPAPVQQAYPGFVGTDGTRFVLDGHPFPVVGANSYYPMYSSPAMVEALFSAAEEAGFTTMRVWGFFAVGSPGGGARDTLADGDKGVRFEYWQDAAGAPAYDDGPDGLRRLDRVVASAREHGLRLVLPLTNNWPAFGGMDQYNLWAGHRFHSDFYTDPVTRAWFKQWVAHLLERRNTVTGVRYRDDPTILAWELANEPRCGGGDERFPRDPDCSADTITSWVAEMSEHLKSLDPRHLVGVGDEGFYEGHEGVDTLAWASRPEIDYLSFHLYPEAWGGDAAWGREWIASHDRAAAGLGKPALLAEFGWRDRDTRPAVYADWLEESLATGGAGALAWMLADDRDDGTPYPDYDGYTFSCPGPVCAELTAYGARLAAR